MLSGGWSYPQDGVRTLCGYGRRSGVSASVGGKGDTHVRGPDQLMLLSVRWSACVRDGATARVLSMAFT